MLVAFILGCDENVDFFEITVFLIFYKLFNGGNAMICKIYDVRSYGAVGDGSTPDGDKIEKAISDLVAGGGGVLYFPPGRYLTHTKHFVRDVSLSIRGDGPSVSVIVWDA